MQYVDVILCNRYYAWYEDYGQTQLISRQLEGELRAWFDTFNKPVAQSEYGAGTIAGFHMVSSSVIIRVVLNERRNIKIRVRTTAN